MYTNEMVPKTWFQAQADCVDKGANLASVPNSGVQSFIANLQDPMPTHYWIGGYLADAKSGWGAWTDGTPWNFTNWAVGEPNGPGYPNGGYCEHCMEMNTDKRAWNDVPCNYNGDPGNVIDFAHICSYKL